MGIFDKFRNEFIDIIEFLDDSDNTIVYRFERYQNEIKNNAKLIVREGQQAIFINEGKIADVFLPGTHTLSTQNLPILSTLKGWKYGFNSPFKAEVYFISTRNFTDQKWGTKNPIILNDQRYGMIELRAFGTYTFKIEDAPKFITEFAGTDGQFKTEEIGEQLKSLIVTRFTDFVGESAIPIEKYAASLNDLSASILTKMMIDFQLYGINLSNFLVENVSMPEEVKKEIFELSRIVNIDLNKLIQYKSAQAISAAAENSSGIAGAGVGIGAGFILANQIGNAFNLQNNPNQSSQLPTNQKLYFLAINNQQSGPFSLIQLVEMINARQLTKDTLVWYDGLNDWQKAEFISEIQSNFSKLPPPLK